eukprot:gene5836-6077_t
MTTQTGISNLPGCAAACAATDNCQFLLFDYLNSTTPCQLRLSGAAQAAANNKTYYLAVKQIGANAVDSANIKSIGNGKYTYWLDATAQQVAGFVNDTSAVTSATCLDTCTLDPGCYAVRIQQSSTGTFENCGYIKPSSTDPWGSQRTLFRAVPARSMPPV